MRTLTLALTTDPDRDPNPNPNPNPNQVRYEDLMADPHTATVDLYSKLFPRSGGHFPGRPAPPRSAAFPAGWHDRVPKVRLDDPAPTPTPTPTPTQASLHSADRGASELRARIAELSNDKERADEGCA